MGDLLIVLLVVACLIWLLIGFFWTVAKILGFLSKLGDGGKPSASTPQYHKPPLPPRPSNPTAPFPVLTSPTPWISERKHALTTARREIQRAWNLGLIHRDTYMEVGRYLDRERELLRIPKAVPEREESAESHAAATTPESLPLFESLEAAPAEPTPPVPAPEEGELAPVQRIAAAPETFEQAQEAKLARVRNAIVKLHEHAQSPVGPEEPGQPDAEAIDVRVADMEVPTDVGVTADTAPALMPDVPPMPNAVPVHPAPPPRPTMVQTVVKKSWAERLFTPENVRILQSLGICIMFISAVAFVRTQMWNEAKPLTRILILIAGTIACSSTGYTLRRWLSLRITGLGFLILGQLSLMLDAYSALIVPGANGLPIYPYSPSSLWTISFTLFTILAAVKSRVIKEPLFDAFTYFGALAAWGAAGLWAGVDPYLLPATFVPALLISAALGYFLRPNAIPPKPEGDDAATTGPAALRVPRWSLPWWFSAGFEMGAVLLAVTLPIAAELSGQAELAQHFTAHAAAIVGLALAIFGVAHLQARHGLRRIHTSIYHAATLLLLLPIPMAANCFRWELATWSMALALPGAGLALLGLILKRVTRPTPPDSPVGVFAPWGLGTMLAGLSWAFVLRCDGVTHPAGLWTAGAAVVVALAYALLEEQLWGPWVATVASGLFASIALHRAQISPEWIPALSFALALIGHAAWSALKRPVGQHGRWSCDCAAALAAGWLLLITPYLPNAQGLLPGVTTPITVGWAALCAFTFATSLWKFSAPRRSAGLALASVALAYAFYHAGWLYGSPAPWIALLALAGVLAWEYFCSDERTGFGPAAMVAHATLLAGYQAAAQHYTSAAVSFGVLAMALLIHSQLQRARKKHTWATLTETLALGYLALTGNYVLGQFQLDPVHWPLALSLMGAGMLALSKVGELLTANFYAQNPCEDERPFRTSAPAIALLCSGISFFQIVALYHRQRIDAAGLLTTTWICGLLPLFLTARPFLGRANENKRVGVPISFYFASIATGLYALTSTVQVLASQFWLPTCPAVLREAVAIYLLAIFAASVFSLVRKQSLGAIPAVLASVGLLGCACGQWPLLPPQFFGLGAAVLCLAAALLDRRDERSPDRLRGYEFAAWLASFFAQYNLVPGLFAWPVQGTQYLAVAAWLILAASFWLRANGRRNAGGAMVALAFASAHALRWLGLPFYEFGPGLLATASGIVVLAEVVRRSDHPETVQPQQLSSRAGAMFIVASVTGFIGLACGLWGATRGMMWQWCATLSEGVVVLTALTFAVRQRLSAAGKPLPRAQLLTLELAAWVMLTFAITAACSPLAASIPLTGPAWVLVGALFLALGMAAESLDGALSGTAGSQHTPAFLESRHLAALALGLAGLFDALYLPHTFDAAHVLWRTLFALSAVAIYGSFARVTVSEQVNALAQKFSGGIAYIGLLPLGYLSLLKAYSNGGSWSGLYFMLLVPLLLAAQYVLQRERRTDQAALARFGSFVVGVGAVVLAFLGNREQLSAVPAAVLACNALQFGGLRALSGKRRYTLAVSLSIVGAAYFALQALVGFPLIDGLNPWAWQMPLLALLGTIMVALGGALNFDEIPLDSNVRGQSARGSIVALTGFFTAFIALLLAVIYAMTFGVRAHFPLYSNQLYLDAVIACTLLLAATTLCAKRSFAGWSQIEALAKYLPPVATLAGYLMFVLKDPPHAAEWYSVPMAVFIFAWAWQSITEAEAHSRAASKSEEREIAILLMLGSALTVLPSFIQELPREMVGTEHFLALLALSIALVIGAMLTRRKIPLLGGSAGVIVGTIVKMVQWAHHRDGVVPLLGITIGLLLVGGSTLLESRMNLAFRKAVDRAKAEARMFWVSWQ